MCTRNVLSVLMALGLGNLNKIRLGHCEKNSLPLLLEVLGFSQRYHSTTMYQLIIGIYTPHCGKLKSIESFVNGGLQEVLFSNNPYLHFCIVYNGWLLSSRLTATIRLQHNIYHMYVNGRSWTHNEEGIHCIFKM